ncbi:SLATT domain-containing protein [Nocardioides mangrovi]|uniref:SLATT domain-containing protein n=1 Tax=Nocardioides mangrovi TaxID=2874580 RepID=UPI0021E14BF5|nr:SLATT domain-containing protein [Nocardioides mangrovi]
MQEAENYGRRRRSRWRLFASVTKFGALALSAAATILLGFAELDHLAAAGFVCTALVTTIGAIEPYFNWRSRWIMAEEAMHDWYALEQKLIWYVGMSAEQDLDPSKIAKIDQERRAVWDRFGQQWLEQRRRSESPV